MKGGKRPGAGRPKGVPNAKTAATVAAAEAGGEMPLAYMLKVMRNAEADPARRDAMAKSAAPFCHAALKAIEHTGQVGLSVVSMDRLDEKA
jgi:hypothetical protein